MELIILKFSSYIENFYSKKLVQLTDETKIEDQMKVEMQLETH